MMARLRKGIEDAPSFVVAQTDVDYRVPILFRPEAYDAWSWISHVGERSLVIESEICDGDTLLSRARVVLVFFDPVTQRATPPPEAFRERLLSALG
jgi:acyl-CoA thioester hydrolase